MPRVISALVAPRDPRHAPGDRREHLVVDGPERLGQRMAVSVSSPCRAISKTSSPTPTRPRSAVTSAQGNPQREVDTSGVTGRRMPPFFFLRADAAIHRGSSRSAQKPSEINRIDGERFASHTIVGHDTIDSTSASVAPAEGERKGKRVAIAEVADCCVKAYGDYCRERPDPLTTYRRHPFRKHVLDLLTTDYPLLEIKWTQP